MSLTTIYLKGSIYLASRLTGASNHDRIRVFLLAEQIAHVASTRTRLGNFEEFTQCLGAGPVFFKPQASLGGASAG